MSSRNPTWFIPPKQTTPTHSGHSWSERTPDQKTLIHTEEWDNLIILDACRYDAFESQYEKHLQGQLIKVLSPASCTRDWLRLTWTWEYPDLTYISTNIFMASKIMEDEPNQFREISKFKKIVDVFLEGLEPRYVNEAALRHEGRKVLHYMQPHLPFIGEVKEKSWEGYLSNLNHVLEYVRDLLKTLKGKTIITSDHGELFTRTAFIEHPCRKNRWELRAVPWFTVKE